MTDVFSDALLPKPFSNDFVTDGVAQAHSAKKVCRVEATTVRSTLG